MSPEPLTLQAFWKCIAIFLRNYHAVNRKIFACKLKSVQRVLKGLRDIDVENASWETLQMSTDIKLLPTTEEDLSLQLENFEQTPKDFEGFVLSLSLLSKKSANNIEAVGIIDFSRQLYVCKYINCNNVDDLSIQFCENQLEVHFTTQRVDLDVSSRWCEFVLRPKLLKWCSSISKDTKQHVRSLQLVDVQAYNDVYKELKRKYANKAMKFWIDANESTDPLKFIYEDLAIASYLICLWRCTDSSPTAFADLGCGNGLLVYVLTGEGYVGYGYDIRARRLWSLYPNGTRLIEQAIVPDKFTLPAEVDWLIGNHSDELSPWVPVLAATVSYKMRYFLLPCCAYEFSGSKFQRRNSSLSVYADFLEYVSQISNKCGYKTMQDRLKIPSTKRIAFVGIDRQHAMSEFHARTKAIWSFVGAERDVHRHGTTGDIKLRDQCEPVRNCTQLDGKIIEELVVKIFGLLMKRTSTSERDGADVWFAGSPLSMHNIVENLSKADLKQIKNECGGIKTLLRNKHEIFKFCGNNLIAIRRPQIRMETDKRPQTVKKRFCFFQKHHPNGCPLTDAECTFLHV